MTIDIDEAIGRTVREFKETSERVSALRSELRRIGQALEQFGTALQDRPALIQLGAGGGEAREIERVVYAPHARTFDVDYLGTLIGELRQLDRGLETLREEMKAFGLNT